MSNESGPRLRRDLVFRPLRREGRRVIELFCHRSGRSMRLSELGYSVAWAMDGQDLVGLADRIQRDLHVELSIETLLGFANRLAALGYLEASSTSELSEPTVAIDESARDELLRTARDELAAAGPPVRRHPRQVTRRSASSRAHTHTRPLERALDRTTTTVYRRTPDTARWEIDPATFDSHVG